MIRSLYVDNFRSLVDFSWLPENEVLMLGYNGSGKSSVLDVLLFLQMWCGEGERLEKVIGSSDITAWSTTGTCEIRLSLEVDHVPYDYSVRLRIDGPDSLPTVEFEGLLAGPFREPKIHREGSHVLMSPGDGSFPINRQQSLFAAIDTDETDPAFGAFLQALKSILVVRPVPPNIDRMSFGNVVRPNVAVTNLVSWLEHLLSNDGFNFELTQLLKSIWPEFQRMEFVPIGLQASDLELSFGEMSTSKTSVRLTINQLSEGEKMLLALYTLAAYQRVFPATTIIVDEPDNFVALSELQPWLLTMLDERPDDGQLILVSHNPEVIQTMGEDKVAFFSRADHLSPTEVGSLKQDESGLSLPERIARGWISA
jgi:predicted ATPase